MMGDALFFGDAQHVEEKVPLCYCRRADQSSHMHVFTDGLTISLQHFKISDEQCPKRGNLRSDSRISMVIIRSESLKMPERAGH